MPKQRVCPPVAFWEHGRPRPHQPDDRFYDPLRSRKSYDRTFTGWVRPRMAALLPTRRKSNGVGSAAVPGRINPTTNLTTRFDHANRTTEHSPAGCGQEWPRSCLPVGREKPLALVCGGAGGTPPALSGFGAPRTACLTVHEALHEVRRAVRARRELPKDILLSAVGALHGNTGLRVQSGFQSAQVKKSCQMSEKEIAAALQAAVKAARAAGSRMRNNLNRTKQANKISHHDVKLALDVECQDIITRQLRRAFPSIPVVGEEGVSGRLDSGFRWVIDPIDGTVNFFHGIPHAAVSIALQVRCASNNRKKADHVAGEISIQADKACKVGYKTVVGAVYDPFLDELWTAVDGQPTRLNGKKVCVSAHNRLADAMMSMGFGKQPSLLEAALPVFGELSFKARKVRITGSAALALAYVACGRFDAHIGAGIRLWDVAAGSLLVECAGGKVQMNCLTPGCGGTIIAVNGRLEAPVLRLAAGLM